MTRWDIFWAVIRRLACEVALPAFCGIAWGVLAVNQEKTAFEASSTGFAAFFFVFFLQAQVLRVTKNVGDRRNAEEWRESFLSLKEGLEELRHQKSFAQGTNGDLYDAQDDRIVMSSSSEHLMAEARRAYASKFLQPAAIVAAMAFEASAREAAVRLGLEAQRSLSGLIRDIASIEPDNMMEKRLRTLVRLRNNLIHPSHEVQAISEPETYQLIDAFQSGIHWIDSLGQ